MHQIKRSIIQVGGGLAVACALVAQPDAALAVDPDKMLDAFAGVFGDTKARASGAKGQCVTGTFTPAPTAASLTRAVTFRQPMPVLARFSMGGGNPRVSDATKAAVRGLAMRIGTAAGATTEFVTISAPIFFAKSPEQMLGYLQARALGPDKKMDPDKVKAFSEANPETTQQAKWLNSRPVPASYVGVTYFAVHGYTFTNAEGRTQVAKLKFEPIGGEAGLSDDEAKAKPADFLVEELTGRLSKGAPAGFRVLAILAQPGDATSNPTVTWTDEEKRPTVELGTIAIKAIESNAACDASYFDPANLADGIGAPVDDPMFMPRKPAYAESLKRRQK